MFPPSPEHAFHAARGCVCPDGLPARPRSQTRHCPGLSVRGGPMRVDGATNSELIHQWRARPDLAADADRQPQRPAGVTNPAVAEMHARDGSPICIFKTDRVGPRAGAGPRTLWVGAAMLWSRAASNHLTTDRPGDGIRLAGDRHGFHASSTLLAVRAAGIRHGARSCRPPTLTAPFVPSPAPPIPLHVDDSKMRAALGDPAATSPCAARVGRA